MTDINRSQGALKMHPSQPSQHKNFEHIGCQESSSRSWASTLPTDSLPEFYFIRIYYLFVCASMGRRGARVSTKARSTGSP